LLSKQRKTLGDTFLPHPVHLRNFKKQQLILTKFYTNNAPSVINQITKFRLNLPNQTIATADFVRLPQNTLVSGLCG